MKECELCHAPARMFCESDQASLCWSCDAKVHCANFLVARHLRSLLCHVCQLPTPWQASGSKLGPTVSICDGCVGRCDGRKSSNEDEEEGEGETDGRDESGDQGGEEADEEDGENQVVPWSSMPPPAASSSSRSSEESSSGGRASMAVGSKRARENADLCSQGDLDWSSCPAATSCYRPAKDRKTDPAQPGRRRTAVIGSMRRYQRQKRLTVEEDILDMCKLSKGHTTAVHLLPGDNHDLSIGD